ncbi:hypothetical protein QK338_05345 [Acinetobacter ursingii]|uniref:hypothetical protein n=1 Tax=Acinetobacter ursingii TaxID=108980 RepID=UPI002499BF41|nr:hypothetical protein [Acinetobacter ursingii]MDI3237541.1 hypothetical protein [Acinetobacter ursingii]
MKHEIILPIALLKAAHLCASDDDFFHPQLENIVIDSGHIVGTDRSIMFYSPLDKVSHDVTIRIPKPHVSSFLAKIENFDTYRNCKLVFDTEINEGYLELPNAYCCYEAFKSSIFQNSYVDWKKAIPTYEECTFKNTDLPFFSPDYLKNLAEISKILGNICFHKIIPFGISKGAIVDFYRTDYFDSKIVVMPMEVNSDKVLYCVEIGSEGDGEFEKVPAESADIAYKAVNRIRNELAYSIGKDSFCQVGEWIKPAIWTGSSQEHEEKMFYKQEWFKKPLKKYDTAEQAKAYILATNDCVECYDENRSITAYTLDDVYAFFAGVIS